MPKRVQLLGFNALFWAVVGLTGLFAPGFADKAPNLPSRSQQVAAYFHLSPREVAELREQGYGYGEIVKILVISDASKRPVRELLARNRQGVGWGTLSRELGLNPLDVKRRVDKVRRDLKIRVRPSAARS